MLGKMLSYDLKALSRTLIPIHIGVIAVGFLCCIAGLSGYLSSEYDYMIDRYASSVSDTIMAMALIVVGACILLMFCAVIATFVLVLVRFYKNLFTDEGYLTLTLPLKAWQQLMSKVLAGLIWMLIDAMVVIGCLTMFAITSGGYNSDYPTDIFPVWILQAANGGLLTMDSGNTGYFEIAILWLGTIFQMLFTLLLAYASLCVGAAAAAKHKLAAGIGIFIGFWTVYSTVGGLISVMVSFNSVFDFQLTMQILSLINNFIELVVIAGCWCLCIWVLNKRVNLP